ncbi:MULTISPECIES: branched-chain amino acid aminotransferase [Inquilinus]|jgi:branched-chain amino acid aminotransferase|uniref:Branched-chain-amino-acid aminotransferase n=1 Tax=Inquilinus ginsengisoli TaxID=363840 RepID=A0ABU1JJC3_9PROT|nr:branched-chain amino acid aminotransferase [Inquilinus ginsengisoli]MDR6288706.1 branched-chain amino acid aminotransferase [Inquilinus ginsengisoli]
MSTTPFHDRDGWIWMDGKLVEWRSANIHVLTHGLHYASSVFEGERAYNGRIFKGTEHSKRLEFSATTLGMKLPYSTAELDAAKQLTLEKNGLTDAYLRPVAWRGSEMMGVSAQANTIHVAIAVWEWPSYFSAEAKMKGIRLTLSDWRRPSPESAPVHAKAAGLYMICTLAKHKAEAEGYQDALMYDYRGYIAEATGANVFIAIDGKLHTPTADCFLNGITRQTAIELARRNGIEVVERHIKPEELANATEVFLTGTAAEITPVGEIGQHRFAPAQICKTVMDAYSDEVRKAPKAVAA